ncbi:MAG: hypothetical protein AMXMBFR64_32880 [Myxococcales bacterium]
MTCARLSRSIVALVALLSTTAHADPLSPVVQVQGLVQTAGGSPASGAFPMTFRLFGQQVGGTALFTQTFASVTVTTGLFDAAVGPFPDGVLESVAEPWLETQVGTEVMPRTRLRPVAYALVARTATLAATAADLACSGCVGEDELGAPWARAATPGGAASDLACTGCVSAAELATGAVTSAAIQDGSIGAADVGFPYAASTSVAGPAVDLACTGCVGSTDLAANLTLQGNVTTTGGLTACSAGQPGCGIILGPTKLSNDNGFLTVLTQGGVRVRSEANDAWRPLEMGGGRSYAKFVVDPGDLTVSGKVGVGIASPGASLHVAGDSIFGGPVTFASTVTYGGDLLLGGNVGIGTNSPAARLDVVGGIKASGPVQVGVDNGPCNQSKVGALRWSGTTIEYCSGTAWQAIYDPAATGGSQTEAAASCLAILQNGYANGDGFYWVDPNGGSNNDAFRVWCDMTTDGGGWTLLFNLDSTDGARHDHDDTAFWLGTGVENEMTSALATGIKTQAFTKIEGGTEMMVLAHTKGVKKGFATYTIKQSYRGKSMHWLMNNVTAGTLTSKRKAAGGTVGATLNVDRPQPEFGDPFINHDEALVVNRQNAWGAAENKARLATTLTNTSYGHTFDGLGGRHFYGGWGLMYESAPITSYCDERNLYGADGNYAGHPSGGNVASTPSCRHGAFAWLPIDTAVFVRETDLTAEKDGSSQVLAAPSCAALASLGKDQDGLYWIDPNGGATADAFPIYCDLNSAGGAGFEVVASCKDALAKGLSKGDGVYLIDPLTPTTGANRFLTWCDMTTDGGGWTLLFNLDSGDGANHHYDDTGFWLGTGTEGSPGSALTAGFKSAAYSKFVKSEELLVVLHQGGTKKGHARYALSSLFKGRTMHWMQNNLVHQPITGGRVAGSGTAGATHNTLRPQSQFGDPFIDKTSPLMINRQTAWGSENRARVATTLTNTEYGHTFDGLGGRHEYGGWGTLYESAPISSYCDIRNLYGGDSNYAGHPGGGSVPSQSSCRHGSFAYLPLDTAVYMREADPLGGADGSSQALAAPSCFHVPPTSAVYWIDPNGGSTADAFQVFCDQTTDGGGWAVTASCKDALAKGLSVGDGVYMIDPVTPSTGANRFLAWCEMTTAGGGWTLVFNAASRDGVRHTYDDTTFWTGTGTEGSVWAALGTGYKGQAYSALPIAAETLVLIHDAGTKKAHAVYDVVGAQQGRTFQWWAANLSDTVVTAPRKAASGTVGATLNVWRPQTKYGDLFVDNPEALVINKQSGWSATENRNRLATTLTNTLYGHTFAGLGGRHAYSGWGTVYESAPISSYCDLTNGYGTDSNYAGHPSGGSVPTQSSCRHGSFTWLPVDTAVLVR